MIDPQPSYQLFPVNTYPAYHGIYSSRMDEYSRNRLEPTVPIKHRHRDLKLVHAGYLATLAGTIEVDEVEPEDLSKNGRKRRKAQPIEITPEKYIDCLSAYLGLNYSDEDVFEFLTAHSALLEAGTFCLVPSRFPKFLDEQWRLWRERHGIADAVVDPSDLVFVVEPVAAKLKPTPANVTAAWEKDLRGEDGAQDELYKLLWLMGLGFVRAKMWDSPNHLSLIQDCVNRSLMAIWETQHTFVGNGYQFYSWCKLIFQRAALKGFWENKNAERIPLEVRDNENPGMMRDNPALYHEGPVQYVRKLPDFIQGYDLQICQFIRQGLDYYEIAKTMGLSEAGVRGRVAAMRARVRADKAAKS